LERGLEAGTINASVPGKSKSLRIDGEW
jgi:hypothetical protein